MAMSNAKRRMKAQRSVENVPDEDEGPQIPRRVGRHRKSSTSRKPKKFR